MIDDIRSFYMKRLYREAVKLLKSEPWMRFNYFEHFMLSLFENGNEKRFTVYFEHYSAEEDIPRKINAVWIHSAAETDSRMSRMSALAGIFADRKCIPKKYSTDMRDMNLYPVSGDLGVYFTDFSSGVPSMLDAASAKFMGMAICSVNEFLRQTLLV